MAKQKGILPLVGTLGGINFYYLNGKPVARRAGGGFTSEAIKKKANMKRVRENSSEFGHCSTVNKVFRTALRPFYKGYRFTFFHSRLMSLFTQLKNLDTTNERGKRLVGNGVAHNNALTFFKRFNYTPDCSVRALLPFKYNIDASSFELTITGFDVKHVRFITGATHIELTYGIMNFDFDTLVYVLHLAETVVLDKDFSGHTLTLTPNSSPTTTNTLLCVLGVRFYQEVDGELYLLNAKEGVGISVLECYN